MQTIFDTSTSIQNEIAKLLVDSSSYESEKPKDTYKVIFENANPKQDFKSVIDDEIDEIDNVEEPRTETNISEYDRNEYAELANTSIDNAKTMSATEIIYRALLNNNEQDLSSKDLSGGNNAEFMINNILKGGNKTSTTVNNANTSEGNQSIINEILDGGINKGINGGFINAFNKYKSLNEAVDDQSSSNSEEEEISLNKVPKNFKTLHNNNISFLSQAKNDTDGSDDSDNVSESESNESTSSEDEFLFPDEDHDKETRNDKAYKQKYLHLIESFKNPKPKSNYNILGGSTTRPKTVTVINAFPYIIKSNTSS